MKKGNEIQNEINDICPEKVSMYLRKEYSNRGFGLDFSEWKIKDGKVIYYSKNDKTICIPTFIKQNYGSGFKRVFEEWRLISFMFQKALNIFLTSSVKKGKSEFRLIYAEDVINVKGLVEVFGFYSPAEYEQAKRVYELQGSFVDLKDKEIYENLDIDIDEVLDVNVKPFLASVLKKVEDTFEALYKEVNKNLSDGKFSRSESDG